MNIPKAASDKEKLQRACALLQMIINADPELYFEIEEETREQLRTWGLRVPKPRYKDGE